MNVTVDEGSEVAPNDQSIATSSVVPNSGLATPSEPQLVAEGSSHNKLHQQIVSPHTGVKAVRIRAHMVNYPSVVQQVER